MKHITVIVLCCLLFNTVSGESVTLPNTFTQGTPAKASEVNANFNALANAVNANAPLMVYDSTGKIVGVLEISNGYYNVIIKDSGGSFLAPIERSGFTIYPAGKYYLSQDCTGVEYYSPGYISNSLIPHSAVVQGSERTYAYVYGDTITNTSYSSAFSWSAYEGSCYPGLTLPQVIAPVARIVDLSEYTPPFSVH